VRSCPLPPQRGQGAATGRVCTEPRLGPAAGGRAAALKSDTEGREVVGQCAAVPALSLRKAL